MDLLFELISKVIIKGIFHILFSVPVAEWRIEQWIVLGTVVIISISILYGKYRLSRFARTRRIKENKCDNETAS